MSQVSRRLLNKETKNKIDSLLIESLTTFSSKEAVSDFISDLLTPTEKIVLSKRLAIAYLLIKGYSYNIIKSTLKVSSPTIGAISIILKNKGQGLRNAINKISQRRGVKNIFTEIGEIAIDLLGKGKGGDWKTTKFFEHQREKERQHPLS